jgi:uncharacterized protein YbjT (DUF2867 family)
MALDGVVAVVGATGRQGGAAAAAAVQAAGAQLVVADFDHPDTVDAALQGASRVFAMTTMDSGRGTEGETSEQLRHEFPHGRRHRCAVLGSDPPSLSPFPRENATVRTRVADLLNRLS